MITEKHEVPAAPYTSEPLLPEIRLEKNGQTIGRSRECDCVITHSSVSRVHARLFHESGHWGIEDRHSRYGTFVNGTRMTRVVLRPDDLIRFGNGPQFVFGGGRLKPQPETRGMNLSLRDVGVWRDNKHLISGVSLDLAAGTFTGLLGRSGSGKSLLLACLSGCAAPTDGTINFDGDQNLQENLDYYLSKLGVVTQDDLVYPYLTVAENLRFAAEIRLVGQSKKELDIATAEVAQKVGLASSLDTKVEDLSGGERKRVGIAIELLRCPRLLLLDEPTSGLDPGTQARLMDTLRGLARQGITVVASTHSTDTLQYFDSVVILGKSGDASSCVFHGPPEDVLPHFGVRTMADLFDALESPVRRSATPSGDESHSASQPLTSSTTGTGAEQTSPLRVSEIVPQRDRQQTADSSTQLWVNIQRTVLGLLRDRSALLLTVLQPIALAVLVVFSQFNQGRSTFIHFFLIIAAIWLGMTLTVRELIRERRLYVRDRLAGMWPSAYLSGKLVYALLVISIQSGILLATSRLLVPWILCKNNEMVINALTTNTPLLPALIMVILVGFCGAIIGLLISTLSRSERAAIAILPLLLLPQALISRVGYGDGGNGWTDAPSPVGPITSITREWRSGKLTTQDKIFMPVSLLMISRPGCAAMDMLAYVKSRQFGPNRIDARDVFAECTFLILLLLVHLLALFLLFTYLESGWSLEQRQPIKASRWPAFRLWLTRFRQRFAHPPHAAILTLTLFACLCHALHAS